MIRCLIADDEPLALDLIEGYIRKIPFLELVARCSSALATLAVLEKENIDLLILDIQMPELSGMELAGMLGNGPKVIFTTAFEQYAIRGYKVDALDYLLKPISFEEFLAAANKARNWFNNARPKSVNENEQNRIIIKSDYKLLQINTSRILFIEGLKDYVKFYLEDEEKPILSLMSMKSLEEKLHPDHFMRIHRSFIVNLDKIKTIERSRIIFGKHYLPVSDKYKEKFGEFIAKRFFT
ncbi:MAG: LytTR family DNA-binding domain-containing protein [Bacteroidetes bacterium]|nr:LytTR family DNA-binding domain-containing protein [Bacteroidota bacterium]